MKSFKIFFAFLVAMFASLALAAPASAGTVPIKATGGTVPIVHNAPSGAFCGVPCMRSVQKTVQAAILLAPPASCTNGSVCGYNDNSFVTTHGYELIPSHTGGYCSTLGLPNTWTSVFNNTGRTIRLFKGSSCSGTDYLQVASGDSHKNLLFSHPTFQDNIERVLFI